MKQALHVFDVDGTITSSDSFLGILEYFLPSKWDRLIAWLRVSPVLIGGILKADLSKTKLALLTIIWKGKKQEDIFKSCAEFFNKKMEPAIKTNAGRYIINLQEKDPAVKVVLLSASCREWLIYLADYFSADLICTELQYDSEKKFNGRYATPNCKGREKVKRLLGKYPADTYEFICYGNEPADKQLQSISKEFYYRYF